MKKFKITYFNYSLGEFYKIYVCENEKEAASLSIGEIERFTEHFDDWFSVENIKEINF